MAHELDVSIIIAAFNAQGQINRALDSAFAQTGVDLEVIVADDASEDDTLAVARAHPARPTVLALHPNQGPSIARNAAMDHARGEWLAVLDADDVMEPSRLFDLLREARAADADIITDNMMVHSASGRTLFIPEPLDNGLRAISLEDFALNNRLFASGRAYGYLKPVFRRSTVEFHRLRYDAALRIGEDYQLVAELLVRGARYIRRRSAGYGYTVQEGSTSHRLTAPAAQAMVDADRRFLSEHGRRLDGVTERAVRAHLKSLQDGLAYVEALDHLKHRRLFQAVRAAASRPLCVRHFHMPVAARLRRFNRGR